MSTENLSSYQQMVIREATKAANSTKNDWPGVPLDQVALVTAQEPLQDLVSRGLIRIVERNVRGRTIRYVVSNA